VRREVFEQTKSYRQGMVQELSYYYLEYQKAEDNHKRAIASVVQQCYADFDTEGIPPFKLAVDK